MLKLLLVAFIIYLIVKTSRNLYRAVRGELSRPTSSRFNPSTGAYQTGTRRGKRADGGWQRTNGAASASRDWDADIEEAKWEDLD